MALSEEDKAEIQDIFIGELRKFVDNFIRESKLSGYRETEEIVKLMAKPLHEAVGRSIRDIESKRRRNAQEDDGKKFAL